MTVGIDFNPHLANGVLGAEVTPRNGAAGTRWLPILASSQAVIEKFDVVSSQTVDGISKFFRTSTIDPRGGATMVEVVHGGQEIPTNQATATYAPNGGTSANIKKASDGSIDTNAWDAVITGTDAVFNAIAGSDGTLNLQFNTGGVLIGKRILAVRVFFQALAAGSADRGPATIDVSMSGAPSIVPRVSIATLPAGLVPSTSFVTYEADLGEIWPIGKTPTTVANIDSLSSGSPHIDLILNSSESDFTVFVQKVWVEVDYCDENRLSRDIVSTGPGSGLGIVCYWHPHKPDGTANFAKVAGTSLSVITRQPRYGRQPINFTTSIYALANPTSLDLPPECPGIYTDASLHDNGAVASLGAVSRRLFLQGVFFVGAVPTPESQPYTYMLSTGDASWSIIRQRFTPPATYNPVGLRLVGDYIPNAAGVAPTLNVSLVRASDNVVFCAGTITQAQADTFPRDQSVGNLRVMTCTFTTLAPLVGGTQYKIILDPSAVRPAGWTFPFMFAADSNSDVATWGGSIDHGNLDPVTRGDFPWFLYEAIDIPGDFEADGGEIDVAGAIGGCVSTSEIYLEVADGALLDGPSFDRFLLHCSITPDLGLEDGGILGGHSFDELALHIALPCEVPRQPSQCLASSIPYAALSWAPTTLGSLFAAYEVQRLDPFGQWATVGFVNIESVRGVIDQEVRRTLRTSYRVRAVTVLGIASAWTPVVTAEIPPGAPGLTFTTNFDHTVGVALGDIATDTGSATRDYTNPEASEQTTLHFAGRDGSVVFRPRERRFDQFSRSLLVNGLQDPEVIGVHAFDPLKDLAKAPTFPYICVRDENGDRWFASITVPDYRVREPFEVYTMTVTVAEVARIPTPTGIAPEGI